VTGHLLYGLQTQSRNSHVRSPGCINPERQVISSAISVLFVITYQHTKTAGENLSFIAAKL
jgi:hypothetical protein